MFAARSFFSFNKTLVALVLLLGGTQEIREEKSLST
jgi:hypothetical protein